MQTEPAIRSRRELGRQRVEVVRNPAPAVVDPDRAHGRAFVARQLRDRLAGLRDDDLLAGLHVVQQRGQVRLRIVDVDRSHG
jgi:hypothetical protein